MTTKAVAMLNNHTDRKFIRSVCRDRGINFDEFVELIAAEVKFVGKKRRVGLPDTLDDILSRIMIEE